MSQASRLPGDPTGPSRLPGEPTGPSRRRLIIGAAATLALGHPALIRQARAEPVTVTDIVGRSVAVPDRPSRIVLADSFLINVLNILEPDPVAVLAGWESAFRTIDPDSFAAFRARFPGIESVPRIGDLASAGASVENVVALRPDLVVLPRGAVGAGTLIERLAALRIPVVVADLFADPLRDTVPTVRLLGAVLGRTERAEAFARLYESRIRRLARLGQEGSGPKTLMQAHAGFWKCCWSPGRDSLGAFIATVGARNIGEAPLPAAGGWLDREYVVAQNPDAYIATGRPENAAQGGLSVGPGVDPTEARRTLAAVADAPDLRTLAAIRQRRVYGLWNFFLDTPANIVAAEVIAKWLRPEASADIDPAGTLAELNATMAVPMRGTYWTTLEGAPGAF